MLESSTIPSFLKQGLICIFTVVPNIYFGLQCTEHTCYDIILISHDLKYSNAIHFARSLRNIGVQTPIILVQNDLSLNVMHEHGAMFCSLLQKPFSANTLVVAICTSIQQHIELVREKAFFDDYLAALSHDAMDASNTNMDDCFAGTCDFDSFYLSQCSVVDDTADQKTASNSSVLEQQQP